MSETTKRIHIGEAEHLLSDNELPFTLDATFMTIRNPDGTWKFETTDLGGEWYFHKFTGTPEDIFVAPERFTVDYRGMASEWPSGIWVWNAMKRDGLLLGFCHREIISRSDPFMRNSILVGLAISYDNGDSWKYLGDICSNKCNCAPTEKQVGNMGGCPAFVKDGWIYLYFNDFDADHSHRITGARMRADEAFEAAKAGRLPEVKKYSGNGVWDTDPINETGAPILPKLGFGVDSHGCGSYVRPLDRFMLVLQTGRRGDLVALFTQDGEHFEDEYLVLDHTDGPDRMQPYSFLISTDGDCTDDMRETGREFYVYYPHKSTKRYADDEFFRRKIVID